MLRGSRAPASRRRNRHCRPFIALAYGTDERESDGGTWEKELGVAGAQPTQDEQKSDAEVTGEATVDPEEDTEAEDDLALDAYAYDDENDNDLAASDETIVDPQVDRVADVLAKFDHRAASQFRRSRRNTRSARATRGSLGGRSKKRVPV